MNSRPSATISREERCDNGWQIVLIGKGTAAKQAEAAGVSRAQIDIMRGVKKKLTSRGISLETLSGMGWDRARGLAQGKTETEWSEDARDAKARQWAAAITQALGGQAQADPDALTLAIYYLTADGSLIQRMVDGDCFEEVFGEALEGAGWVAPEEEEDRGGWRIEGAFQRTSRSG